MRPYSNFSLSHFLEGCISFIPSNYSTLIIPSTLPSSKGLQTTVQNPINTSKPCETYQWPYYWKVNYGIRQLSLNAGTDFRFIKLTSLSIFCSSQITYYSLHVNVININKYDFLLQTMCCASGFVTFWATKCHTQSYLSVIIPTQRLL